MKPLLLACAALALIFNAPLKASQDASTPRILVIGDSLMAAHALSGRSIAGNLRDFLGEDVVNRSVIGARMIYKLPISGHMGLSIPAQFRKGQYDWVIMNGGGNDLWMGCGCNRCDRKMNKLISTDGTRGEIPKLMSRIVKTGAQVVYVGYLRSPDINTPIESCKDEGDELESRISALADRIDSVHYLSIQDLVPPGDLSYFGVDRVHPSLKASREIAGRVADLLKQRQATR
ncbi:MAG: SGNH/GDSL hydrolase family protein [Brevirhabdus sp.]